MRVWVILSALVLAVIVAVAVYMVVIITRGRARSRSEAITVDGKPSRWRKVILAVVLVVVVWFGGKWMLTAGNNHPHLGLWVAVILALVAAFASFRLKCGWWLPFVWLIAACLFAKVSISHGAVSQPGSILTAFGTGKDLVGVTAICVLATILMAMIERNRMTWVIIVVALSLIVVPAWWKLYRFSDQLAALEMSGGERASYGIAVFDQGIVKINADIKGLNGIYRVMSRYTDGTRCETFLRDGQQLKLWRLGTADMTHPECIEVRCRSSWERPFDNDRTEFVAPTCARWLEFRLPANATGQFDIGMSIF